MSKKHSQDLNKPVSVHMEIETYDVARIHLFLEHPSLFQRFLSHELTFKSLLPCRMLIQNIEFYCYWVDPLNLFSLIYSLFMPFKLTRV